MSACALVAAQNEARRDVQEGPEAASCNAAYEPPFHRLIAVGELLGQPRFPKPLNHQLRV